MIPKAVTILSGGMDSTTLVYQLAKDYEQILISFDYGQRHKRELACAAITAKKLDLEHIVIELPVGPYLTGSSLTDTSVQMPHGHYEEENMRKTVVPGRNAIMLSIAWGVATARKAEIVAYGAHAGDHAIYPDCRPEFIHRLVGALKLGVWDGPEDLLVPYQYSSKADIVRSGLDLEVPYQDSWTCYEGGEVSCGICGSCCERLEAFNKNSVEDPLEYQDRTTWKKFLENRKSATS